MSAQNELFPSEFWAKYKPLPGVDVEGLGDEPHEVPVLRQDPGVMQHPRLAVVLAVAVRVAVVPATIQHRESYVRVRFYRFEGLKKYSFSRDLTLFINHTHK